MNFDILFIERSHREIRRWTAQRNVGLLGEDGQGRHVLPCWKQGMCWTIQRVYYIVFYWKRSKFSCDIYSQKKKYVHDFKKSDFILYHELKSMCYIV